MTSRRSAPSRLVVSRPVSTRTGQEELAVFSLPLDFPESLDLAALSDFSELLGELLDLVRDAPLPLARESVR